MIDRITEAKVGKIPIFDGKLSHGDKSDYVGINIILLPA
jgi:hypothetical protein